MFGAMAAQFAAYGVLWLLNPPDSWRVLFMAV